MSNRAEVILAIKAETYKETATQKVKNAIASCDAVYKVDEIYYFYWGSVKWDTLYSKDESMCQIIRNYLTLDNSDGIQDDDVALKVLWPPFETDCDDDIGSPHQFDIGVRYELTLPDDKTELNKEEFFASNAEKFINNIKE